MQGGELCGDVMRKIVNGQWLILMLLLVVASEAVDAEQPAQSGQAETSSDGIQIVTGVFGRLGRERKLDIMVRLQQLCGTASRSCQVFCSETSFGRYSLGRRPICRVTYRRGPGFVRSVEAAREEPILMKCPEPVEVPPYPAPVLQN